MEARDPSDGNKYAMGSCGVLTLDPWLSEPRLLCLGQKSGVCNVKIRLGINAKIMQDCLEIGKLLFLSDLNMLCSTQRNRPEGDVTRREIKFHLSAKSYTATRAGARIRSEFRGEWLAQLWYKTKSRRHAFASCFGIVGKHEEAATFGKRDETTAQRLPDHGPKNLPRHLRAGDSVYRHRSGRRAQ